MNEYVVITVSGERVRIGAEDFQADASEVDFIKKGERVARFYAQGISGFFKVRDYDKEQES